MDVGDFIRRKRLEKGWSQDELAFRAHISPRLIGRYERKEGLPDHERLNRICRALGVPLPWFSGDSDESSTARKISPAILGRADQPSGLPKVAAGL
jgi:transcriptional regulator with XRE-family HTH domain